MTQITEVAPDIFRISTYIPEANLQFAQYLVRDREPLLFHTGMKALFPAVKDAVAKLIDPSTLRWIGFSHFEADECGSLNEWLEIAPQAQAVCSLVGAMVSVNDFAIREARPLMHDEVLETGEKRYRFRHTPHVPHCWEAGLMFEETTGTLLASDIMTQFGDVEAVSTSDTVERSKESLLQMEASPLANYMPFTHRTLPILNELASLEPKVIATMHGTVYQGDGGRAIREWGRMMAEVMGPKE